MDPDILVYPILASVNDILVTASFAGTVLLVLRGGAAMILLEALFTFMLALTALIAWRNWGSDFFRRTLREGTTVVMFSSLFGSANGVLLSSLGATITRDPGLVVLYPALTNALGNIGSIVGSTTTTNIALGYAKSLREEVREIVGMALRVESAAFVMHVVFAALSYLIASPGSGAPDFPFLLRVALTSNLITFMVISLIALTIALQAHKRGLNPDNVTIPFITTVSDSTATASMVPAIALARLIVA